MGVGPLEENDLYLPNIPPKKLKERQVNICIGNPALNKL